MVSFKEDYNRHVKLIEQLIPDCGSQIGALAVGAQKAIDRAFFEHNEIGKEEWIKSSDKLGELIDSFAFDCRCNRGTRVPASK